MKICLRCGLENKDEAGICRNCGSLLKENKPADLPFGENNKEV